jgi:hypothetical protein
MQSLYNYYTVTVAPAVHFRGHRKFQGYRVALVITIFYLSPRNFHHSDFYRNSGATVSLARYRIFPETTW